MPHFRHDDIVVFGFDVVFVVLTVPGTFSS